MRNAGYKYACEDSNWLRRQQQEGPPLSYSAGPIDYACTHPAFSAGAAAPMSRRTAGSPLHCFHTLLLGYLFTLGLSIRSSRLYISTA